MRSKEWRPNSGRVQPKEVKHRRTWPVTVWRTQPSCDAALAKPAGIAVNREALRRTVGSHYGGALFGVVVGVLAVVLWGGLAFACVPGPFVSVEPQASGVAGSTVEVVGVRFEAGPVEVRWNAIEGDLLARATGPEFRSDVVVPAGAKDGLYSIVALTRLGDGRVAYVTGVSFQVVGSGSGKGSSTGAVDHRVGASPSKRSDGSTPLALVAVGGVGVVGGLALGLAVRRRKVRPEARRAVGEHRANASEGGHPSEIASGSE